MNSTIKKGRIIVLFSLLISLLALGVAALALFKAYHGERLTTRAREVVEEARTTISEIDLDLSLREIKGNLSGLQENLGKIKDEVVISNLQKIKERLNDAYQSATPKYKEKITELSKATDGAIEAVKSKAKDAGEKIESLIKSIDSFLTGEKEQASKEPESN